MNGEPTPAATHGCFGCSNRAIILTLLIGGGLWLVLLYAAGESPVAPRISQTQNNLKRIGLGLHNYHSGYRRFPPPPGDEDALTPPTGWMTALLPYMDKVELWRRYDPAVAYDAPANAAVVGTPVEAYLTPADGWRDRRTAGGFGLAHYAGNKAVLGPGGSGTYAVPDGTVNTLLAGQIDGFARPWADPENLRDPAAGLGTGPRQFGTPFRYDDGGYGMIVMCDGSVKTLSADIDPAVFAALGTPDGGEDVGEF